MLCYDEEKIDKKQYLDRMRQLFGWMEHTNKEKLLDKFLSIYLNYIFFFNINSYREAKRIFANREVNLWSMRSNSGGIIQRTIRPFLIKLIALFMVYSYMKLIVQLYIQCIYNRRWYTLRRSANCDLKTTPLYHCNDSALTRAYEEIKLIRSYGKALGTPYIDFELFSEFLYTFTLFFFPVNYFGFVMRNHKNQMLDYGLRKIAYGDQLDREHHLLNTRRIVNHYIWSSCKFHQINWSKFVRLAGPNDKLLNQCKQAYVPRHKSYLVNIQQSLYSERELLRRVRHLAQTGHLSAFNKTTMAIQSNTHFLVLILLGWNAYVIFCVVALGYLIPFLLNLVDINTNLKFTPRDLIWMIEYSISGLFFGQSAAYFISLTLIGYIDQFKYVSKLLKQIQLGKTQLADYKRQLIDCECDTKTKHNLASQLKAFKVRESVLIIVLQYKHFVEQLKTLKRSISSLAFIALVSTSVLCIWVNINSIYLRPEARRIFVSVIGWASLLCNVLFLPTCQLKCRCASLHRGLSSLLAQTVDVFNFQERRLDARSQGNQSQLETLSDDHLVWFMRRELNYSGIIEARYVIRCCGVPLTYSTWLKTNFLLGIIVSQILATNNDQGGVVRLLSLF